MRARIESATSGLERYVQDWLEQSRDQAVQVKERAEVRAALFVALVERLAALELRLAELSAEVEELRRREMRPGTPFGRWVWRILGVEYGSETDIAGDGSESGGDGDDHSEHGLDLDPG